MERYRVSRDIIASVPEIRTASHILLLCGDSCDGDAVREETEALRQRALEGEPFDELALEYSQDPGSKTKGGRLSMGIQQDAENVDQSFRDGLFGLTNVGDISEVVRSRFGFHVIRLEGVTDARIRSFEEVEDQLVAQIEQRYREDAYQQRIMSLAPKEPLEVDSAALDAILGPLPTESDQ
jgi:parvulin-like peptidyl-prolyl isomerase